MVRRLRLPTVRTLWSEWSAGPSPSWPTLPSPNVYSMPRRVMQALWLSPQVTTAAVISSSCRQGSTLRVFSAGQV